MNDPWHEGESGSSFAPRPKPSVSPEKRIEELQKELASARSQINHLEDSNMKLYAGRDCPNCGVRVEMHTESDLVLIKQSVLDELNRIKETSIPVASAGEGRKLKQAIEQARREGTIEGENEFARWIDRKGAIILDSGEDEKAVEALYRYRMGRGW